MSSSNSITERSIDQVEESLIHGYQRVDINEYRALVGLREYDLRQGWQSLSSSNLVLCGKHHRLHHEGGYGILKDYKGRGYFKTVTGKTIPHRPIYEPALYDAETDTVSEPKQVKDAPRGARYGGRDPSLRSGGCTPRRDAHTCSESP